MLSAFFFSRSLHNLVPCNAGIDALMEVWYGFIIPPLCSQVYARFSLVISHRSARAANGDEKIMTAQMEKSRWNIEKLRIDFEADDFEFIPWCL
ncbi:hypothetical protein NPIL_660151 [Nephila pilipes]|uniref:Uncharacterized protein n=1 Tax=Nephila pilipes TaxID=299642 RepID=A0A8X6IKX1_NEPPI|nr:hypothetical protein NPIL_660151 [Nephila pilipes]